MHVADLESSTIPGKSARSECRQTPLVRQLCQWVDLVHELRQLASPKEVADDGRKRLRVNQLLRGHRFDALVEQSHALFDQPFGSSQADTALVGEQLAYSPHAPAAEVI